MGTSVRRVAKRLCPPAVFDLYVSAKKRWNPGIPEWHAVETGPAKGARLLVNQRSPVFASMVSGRYDSFFWEFLDGIPLKGATICDVGGHIGYHALAFAGLVGSAGSVATFEPNTSNLERIRVHLDENPELGSSVRVFPFALGASNKTTTLHTSQRVDDETSSGGFIAGAVPPLDAEVYRRAGFSTEPVEVKTLDSVVASESLKNIGAMKVDVEGGEVGVLEGARATIRHHRPVMLIEAHTSTALVQVVEILLIDGYQVSVLEDTGSGRAFVGAKHRESIDRIVN